MAKTKPARRSPQITPKKFERLKWGPRLRERKTTTDSLANALRTAIYDGQFADGEELNQVELAEFFGVSRVPVREALRELQAEGLVKLVAHHRTVVSGLTLSEIMEMIEMRAVLEAHMLRKAAPGFSEKTLQKLRKTCEEMDLVEDYGARWVLKNWEFHRLLLGDISAVMIEAVEKIQLSIERYARRFGTATRRQRAAVEHGQIVDAIERGAFDDAAGMLHRHILHTGEEIRDRWEDAVPEVAV